MREHSATFKIGTWKEGAFTPLAGKVTDENGEVKLVFTELGEYLINGAGRCGKRPASACLPRYLRRCAKR